MAADRLRDGCCCTRFYFLFIICKPVLGQGQRWFAWDSHNTLSLHFPEGRNAMAPSSLNTVRVYPKILTANSKKYKYRYYKSENNILN